MAIETRLSEKYKQSNATIFTTRHGRDSIVITFGHDENHCFTQPDPVYVMDCEIVISLETAKEIISHLNAQITQMEEEHKKTKEKQPTKNDEDKNKSYR